MSESETIYTRTNLGNFSEKAEKHIPVISISGTTVTVNIGAEAHPMEEAHFIQWVALYSEDQEIARKNLQHGELPSVTFENVKNLADLKARASCNLHGVWESD